MEKLPDDYQGSFKPQPGTAFGLPKKREQVITILGDAFAENNLEVDEYERRLEIAHNAKSLEALRNAIHDFPQVNTVLPIASQKQATSPFTPSPEEPSRFISLIGDIKAKGLEIASPSISHVSLIGDTFLDLRKIAETHPHLRIESYTGIGDLKILVPANTKVRKNLFTLIGETVQRVKGKGFWKKLFGKEEQLPPVPASSLPPVTLEIVGFKLIGDVVIEFERDVIE